MAGNDATRSAAATRDSSTIIKELRKRVRRAAGDAQQIAALVQQAEQDLAGDQYGLCEAYSEAMRGFGQAGLQAKTEALGDVCLKRLRVLCRIDPKEAEQFVLFLRHQGIRQQDAQPYMWRAEMALRKGDATSAAAALQEGISADARPVDQLRALLQQCQGPAVTCDSRTASIVSRSNTPLEPRQLRYSNITMSDFSTAEQAARFSTAAAPRETREAFGSQKSRSRHDAFEGSEQASDPAAAPVAARSRHAENQVQVEPRGVPPPGGRAPPAHQATRGSAVLAGVSPIAGVDDSNMDVSANNTSLSASFGSFSPRSTDHGAAKPAKTFTVNGEAYAKLRTIGRGGSSKVYEVQTTSGQILALKRAVVSGDASHFDELAKEVDLLRQLKGCPSVVDVLNAEVDRDRKVIHIVMERGERDLSQILQEPDLTIGDIQAFWRQMLEAVEAIHGKRIVHSDLKPGNFLLVGGRLKLIDFGIARKIADHTVHISRERAMGTISYMAPEAISGSKKLGRASDIWSLGVVLYQMVYGHCPFAHLEPHRRALALCDPNHAVVFPPEHRLRAHSESTKAVVMSALGMCLQRDPDLRPSAQELLQHEFLQHTANVTRSAVDRAMEAMVTGLCEVAEEVLCGPTSSREEGEFVEGSSARCCWPQMSDEVWRRISKKGEEGEEHWRAPLRECFQRFLTRGSKRQRIANDGLVEVPRTVPTRTGIPPAQAALRPESILRPPVATNAAPASEVAPRPKPVTRAEAPSFGPGAGTRPPPSVSRDKPQCRNAPPVITRSLTAPPGGAAPIQAHMLEAQMGRLKKVQTRVDKENASPAPGVAASANVGVQRLKEKMAMLDDYEEPEHTVTQWVLPSRA